MASTESIVKQITMYASEKNIQVDPLVNDCAHCGKILQEGSNCCHENVAYMIFPGSPAENKWTFVMSFALVMTMIFTPLSVAFSNDQKWILVISYAMDFIFLVDIVLNFNTAIYDKDYIYVESNRRTIAIHYLKGWFTFDVLVVIPFEFVFNQSVHNSFSKLSRLGRILKLAKLFKMLKVFKLSSKMINKVGHHLSSGYDRLLMFIIIFFLFCHVATCLQIAVAYDYTGELHVKGKQFSGTWLEKFQDDYSTDGAYYCISFYWAITTITTVGYGDISANNLVEMVFSCCMMLIGVISFGFANGMFTSIISDMDTRNGQLQEKMEVLDRVDQQFQIPKTLYRKIKKHIKFAVLNEAEELNQFLEELPVKLNNQVSQIIFNKKYAQLKFFQKRSQSFITWAVEKFNPMQFDQDHFIYKEGDEINNIYFLNKGQADLVLPYYDNQKYVQIKEGNHFGIIDIIGYQFFTNNQDIDKWYENRHQLRRQFTVMASTQVELLYLSISDLYNMQMEFTPQYMELFHTITTKRFRQVVIVKLDALAKCQEYDEAVSKGKMVDELKIEHHDMDELDFVQVDEEFESALDEVKVGTAEVELMDAAVIGKKSSSQEVAPAWAAAMMQEMKSIKNEFKELKGEVREIKNNQAVIQSQIGMGKN